MSTPLRYMIRCDIEGVSGVVSYTQAEPGQSEYAFGLRMFKSDLLACVNGLLDGGADEVVIYDEHYYGRNVDPAWLPPKVSVIAGKPPYRADWAGGLDDSFAGVVLLGFHSKFGTPGGLLAHSYELDIAELRLNGVSVGEIGMEAAIAGDWGVPVTLVTGDSAGVAEAEARLPGVVGVVVKEALSESGACCLPLHETRDAIRWAAAGVVQNPPEVAACRLDREAVLEIECNDGPYLRALRKVCGREMSDKHTLTLHGPTATAVWADYWQRKFRAQKAQEISN